MNMNESTLSAPAPAPWRRRLLCAAALSGLGLAPLASAHGVGTVRPPLSLPRQLLVQKHDGARVELGSVLMGRLTALQLMFTGCSEVCAIQGAVFASVQSALKQHPIRCQLLSMTIDPHDDARAMSTWLRRFGAQPGWSGIVPLGDALPVVLRTLQNGAAPSGHSSQVFFIDERCDVVWRSEDLPTPDVVVRILQRLSVNPRR